MREKIVYMFILSVVLFNLTACSNNLSNKEKELFENRNKYSICNDLSANIVTSNLKDNATDKNYCESLLKQAEKDNPVEIKPVSDMNVPRSNNFADIIPVNLQRSDFKSILLNDGRALIIGGNEGKNISAEIFDPETETFELISNNINKYCLKHLNSIYDDPFLLSDGQVYFEGAIFNPKTNQFSKPNNVISKRIFENDLNLHTTEHLRGTNYKFFKTFKDGKILFGLNCNIDNECTEVLLFDPVNNNNFKPAKLSINKDSLDSILLKNNKVLIIECENNSKQLGKSSFNTRFKIYDPIVGNMQLLDITILGSMEINSIQLDENQILIFAPDNELKSFGDGLCSSSYILNLKNNKIIKYLDLPLNLMFKESSLNVMFNNNNILLHTDSPLQTILLDLDKFKKYTIISPELYFDSQNYVPLNNNKILVIGGRYTYKADPERRKTNKAVILKLKDKK